MLTELLLIPILSFIISYFIWVYIKLRRIDKMTENIPGPKGLPLIGSAHLFFKVKTALDLWKTEKHLFKTYGFRNEGIIKVWIGNYLGMVIYDSDYAETVLKNPSCLSKDKTYDDFKVATEGVVVTSGEKWKLLRKPLNKLFNNKMLEESWDVFDKYGDTLTNLLAEKAAKHKPINIKHYISLYSLDCISKTHFLFISNELKNNSFDFMRKVETTFKEAFATAVRPTRWIKFIFDRTSEGITLKKHCYELRGPLREIIQWHLNKGTLESEQEEIKSYIDIILRVGKYFNLDLDGLSHLGSDFLIAGTDTISTSIAGCLLCLASFPEYQEAVYKEQVEVMGNRLTAPTKNELAQMHYLDRVIYETLRLWAPIGIHRYAEQDIKLDDKYTIPKGTAINVSLYMVHRNPKYYERPYDFYPDHFLPEKIAARPKFAFCAFSTGQRGCPGKYYAQLSIKMTVSRIIRRFRLTTNLNWHKLKLIHCISLEPADGFMLKLEERNR